MKKEIGRARYYNPDDDVKRARRAYVAAPPRNKERITLERMIDSAGFREGRRPAVIKINGDFYG